MNYYYDTATEKVFIEASKKWTDIVKEEDRKIASQDRKERKHNVHYDPSMEYGEWLASEEDDPFFNLCRETHEEKLNRLRYAIKQLNEDQQRLIEYVYYRGYSMKAFAEMEGVSPVAITYRHKAILRKLKEIY